MVKSGAAKHGDERLSPIDGREQMAGAFSQEEHLPFSYGGLPNQNGWLRAGHDMMWTL